MTATDSYLLLRALIDELARCGMRHACTCPGSRNTPIVLTLAREKRITAWSHIDERCAAFFALGAAKASGRPVAVTCSSGTAAANMLPAVIEAQHAGVPLIVLTADRPPELRDIGAGQTIDQLKLYGSSVKWFFELGVHEATPENLRWIRALACRAYLTACEGRPGPVHLNIPLREPLVLEHPLPAQEPGGGGRHGGRPWVIRAQEALVDATPGTNHAQNPVLPIQGRTFQRPVLVAGELGGDPRLGPRLSELAGRLRVPLLADALSGARSGPAAITHFDLILREPRAAAALAPDAVVRIGELPTSKPLRAWIAGLSDAAHLQMTDAARWSDPASRVDTRAVGPVSEQLDALERWLGARGVQMPGAASGTDPGGWLERWRQADRAVADAIDKPLQAAGLCEPAVAATLARLLPSTATLFVAASMPIRDVEEFFPTVSDPPRVLANRGANGIDGTVSSAFGVAAAASGGREVVLLLGDVTLAHDAGGLLAASRCGLKLTVVLINNSGGGIFNFLAVAGEGEAFERHIATPTGLDFSRLAALYGLAYHQAISLDDLGHALTAALSSEHSTLIEVRTERVANRALHAEIEAAALRALAEPVPH